MSRFEPRPWDSTFFGVSIAQIVARRASSEELSLAIEQARLEEIDCLYFLADANDAETVRAAEANRFALVDVRLTLDCAIARAGNGAASTGDAMIRPARPEDLPRLTAIARISHRYTRFHVDTRFDPARSDELYAEWIARSVEGKLADAVWVVQSDEAPRGYITASRGGTATSIGLIAVEPEYRGRGYGDRLLRAMMHWSASQGVDRVSVVTQGRSAPAVRFYERAGFTASTVEFWYHCWLRYV